MIYICCDNLEEVEKSNKKTNDKKTDITKYNIYLSKYTKLKLLLTM